MRNKNSQIFKIVQKILSDLGTFKLGTFKFTLAIFVPKLYKLLGLQCMSQEVYSFFHRVVIETMEERERNKISRPDIIHLLLHAKKGQLQ